MMGRQDGLREHLGTLRACGTHDTGTILLDSILGMNRHCHSIPIIMYDRSYIRSGHFVPAALCTINQALASSGIGVQDTPQPPQDTDDPTD